MCPGCFGAQRRMGIYRFAFLLFAILSISSLSIHSSVYPQEQHMYLFTFTDEKMECPTMI